VVVSDMPAVSALADEERIHQVMVNLLQNAIKFTPPGGKVEVTARVAPQGVVPDGHDGGDGAPVGSEVVFCVSDTGVGIAAQDLPRIFERFYKADRARSGGGTGLGLAIAKHIVQAHGGRIWAESSGDGGSRFQFGLIMVKEER
jgi:two-component system phosphate regulon sensor histidine kinase PhoR